MTSEDEADHIGNNSWPSSGSPKNGTFVGSSASASSSMAHTAKRADTELMLASFSSSAPQQSLSAEDIFCRRGVEITRAQRSDMKEISFLLADGFKDIFSWVGADPSSATAMCLLELEYNFECDLGKLGVARAQGEDDILGAILLVTDVDQKQRLDSPMRTYLNILGCCGMCRYKKLHFLRDPSVFPDECYISWIIVRENSRGKGVGTVLLQWAEELAHEMMKKSLKLFVANSSPAKRLYERLGYKEERSLKTLCALPIFWCASGYFQVRTMKNVLPASVTI